MTSIIRFVGTDPNTSGRNAGRRIWGYITESTEHWGQNSWTFWGTEKGNLYFHRAVIDHEFKKSFIKKLKKYKGDNSLNDKVLNEFSRHRVVRKLKLGY